MRIYLICDESGAVVRRLAGEAQAFMRQWGLDKSLDSIRADCARLQIHYDNWFSEKGLHQSGLFDRVFQMLQERGNLVENLCIRGFSRPCF